jgi:putative ABC transport system permease protein
MLEQTWRDLRLAWRGLRRAPAFAVAAVLTLAVGIAGTTATFALLQGVLLRPLPVPDQDRLLLAWNESGGTGHWPFSVTDFETLRDGSRTLEGVAAVGYNGALPIAVTDGGTAGYVKTASVTGDFFDVLGVPPVLGRALRRADDVAGAEHVLVITHGLWQRRYGGSPDVIGRPVIVQRQQFTIVGVMPRDVEYPRGVEAWTTVAATMSVRSNEAFQVSVDIVARMKDAVTIEQATSELNTLAALIDANPKTQRPPGLTVVARSYADVVVGDMRTAIFVLFGAVGLVLLIASANVANLLLLRSDARGSELAVRLALGAGRFGLARQVLAESLVLALAASIIGLIVTSWTLQALVSLVPGGLVRAESVRMDAGVTAFCAILAFLTSALAGIVPALATSGSDLVSGLRSGGRGHSGTAMRRSRRGLVVAQVALAVTTVAAAGLLVRSMINLEAVGTGLAAGRLVLVPLELPQPKYADRARHLQFLKDVVARLEALPDVIAATPVNAAPLSGVGWDAPIAAEGQTAQAVAANPLLNLESIHPNYFAAFEVPLVRGRPFTADDRDGTADVAIVSEDVAEWIWPGQNPLGKRFKLGSLENPDNPWRTIVGIARPTRYRELSEPRATMYLPAEQFLVTAQTLVVRTTSPAEVVGRVVSDRVRAIDPDVQVMRAVPFVELLARPLARPRFNAFLIGVFGAAALLLACVGLYAVMAAYVRQRSREIGIRVALGATTADVRHLVLSEGLWLTGIGVGIGLASALGSASMLRSLLYDVHPLDPATMLSACLLLVGVSALASYLPARGAARIDPITALRAD